MFKCTEARALSNDFIFLLLWTPLATWVGTAYLGGRWLNNHSLVRSIYFALPPAAYLILLFVPRIRSNPVFRNFVTHGFKMVCLYVFVVSAGTVLLLLGSSAVGYLSYSDRPGPGWGMPPHLPGLDEIGYFSGWAVLLLPMCYFFGVLLFAFVTWITWLNAPSWLIRVAVAVFCAGVSMLSVAAAGWYIAIAPFVTNCVGVFGLLFGAFVLPRMSFSRKLQLTFMARAAGIGIACLGMIGLLVYPFLR